MLGRRLLAMVGQTNVQIRNARARRSSRDPTYQHQSQGIEKYMKEDSVM
jgi:hypothetical protein